MSVILDGGPTAEPRASFPIQVARDCGYLPMALAIVGCLPRLKSRGLDSAVWRKVHEDLMVDKSGMQRAKGGAGESLGRVLDASFDVLSSKKQEELLRMAVLAKGVLASEDMLLNLWQREVRLRPSCSYLGVVLVVVVDRPTLFFSIHVLFSCGVVNTHVGVRDENH